MTDSRSYPQRVIGLCSECGFYVFVRKDGTAYKHRERSGAPDQICFGSGYAVRRSPGP